MAQGDYGTPSNRVNIVAEQWKYTPHTSDPPNTEKGDEWLRVDMDSGNKIATLRFQYNDNGDVYDIPVLPAGTSNGAVEEVLSFDTPNGVGYIPAADPTQYNTAFPKRRYHNNGTTYAFHDSTSASPDSAIHRWRLAEDSGTFADPVGNADATDHGTTRVTDTWQEGAARWGDGSSAYVESTTWGSFGSSMTSDFAIGFTIQSTALTYSPGMRFIATLNDGETVLIVGTGQNESWGSGLWLFLRDADGNSLRKLWNVHPDDGKKHRILINKNTNDVAEWELYHNAVLVTDSYNEINENFTNPANFDYPVTFFAGNSGGGPANYVDGILDDIVIYDSSPSVSEIEDDYNMQPWAGSENDSTAHYFALNGLGSPVYSTNQPAAVYNSNDDTTFVVYQGPNIDPYAMAYDHTSSEWTDATQIGTNPLTDDNHGVPAVTQDDSGILHCFWGSHTDPMQYARTTNANDISSWTSQVGLENDTTYANPVSAGSTLYLFYRRRVTSDHRPEQYITSTDGGSTWSSPTNVIDFSDRTIYVGDVWQDGSDIHIVWDDAPTPDLERYDVYYVRLDTTDNTLYAADGTSLGTTVDQTEADNNALVYDSGSDYTIVPRVRIDGSGNPHIIWSRNTGTDETGEWTYEYSRWTGSSWTTPEAITTAEGVTEGAAFVLNSASDITAQLAVPDDSDGLVNIEEWQYDGTSWSQSDTILQGSEYGKDLATPTTPMPYSDDLNVLFTEFSRDYTTNLKVFAHGSNGFIER